jgi:hypothetical protein
MDVLQLLVLQLTLIAKGIEYSNGSNDMPIKVFSMRWRKKKLFPFTKCIKKYLSHKKNINLRFNR